MSVKELSLGKVQSQTPIHFITHSDSSRGSKAFSGVCDSVILSVCVSVSLHDKTKTAETKITKLGTEVVHHESSSLVNIRSKGQRSKLQGHKVQKGDRVAGMSYGLYRVPSL